MKKLIAISAAALLLTACSAPAASQPEPASVTPTATATPTPTATALPAGTFKLTTTAGADITFTLPTPVTDPAVAELEAYRVKTGGAPVSYLVADVDNRKGAGKVNMYMVSAFNEEGRQFTFSAVAQTISSWSPTYQADGTYLMPNGKVLSDAVGSPLSSQGTDLHNAHINDADAGERATLILTSADVKLPKTFTRVTVQPSGAGEPEEATPAA